MPVAPKIDHSHTFGKEVVTPEERDRRMRDAFRRLAPYYDRLCDVQSLGLHRHWRRVLAQLVAAHAGQRILDVAGGSGEMARLFAGPDREVVVLDFSLPMLEVGRSRETPNVAWVTGRSRALPFPQNSMNIVTIAFGLRNVTYVGATLSEALRVLKPGGRLYCLEASHVPKVLEPLYRVYCRYVVPWLGARITKEPQIFAYLVESIRGFPSQAEIRDLLEHVGFTGVHYYNLSMGIACIHVATKP